MTKLKVELLLTGNELMSGDVIDSNSAVIAQQLKTLGLEISRRVTVKDDTDLLSQEIISQSQRADILIINGGLGPTVDDMTAQALADAAQLPLAIHQQALSQLTAWCEKRSYELNQANKKQAVLPQGCDIITNDSGSACGFHLRLNGCAIYTTPGVPSEMVTMIQQEIVPAIERDFKINSTTDVSRFQVFGIGESTIQQLVSEHLSDWPAEIELGFRASMPLIEMKLTTDTEQGHGIKALWQNKLEQLLGGHVIGQGKTSLAQALVEALQQQHKSVAFAESCTGGLMSSLLTQVSGCSEVFEAGFVTYSNAIKAKIISVSEHTLTQFGAVSSEVVLEMAQGALKQSGSDYVVAVSGIAGPGGGSIDKPVGTVWLAWGEQGNIQTIGLAVPLPRIKFQQYVAAVGLDLIRRHIIGITTPAYYIEQRALTNSAT